MQPHELEAWSLTVPARGFAASLVGPIRGGEEQHSRNCCEDDTEALLLPDGHLVPIMADLQGACRLVTDVNGALFLMAAPSFDPIRARGVQREC